MKKDTPKTSIKISNIKERLPYIWDNRRDNGPDFCSGNPIRPDQYKCYVKKYLSEHDCAAILIGLPFPNAVCHLIEREIRKSDNKLSSGTYDLVCDLDNTMALRQLNLIFTEIKEMFSLSREDLSPREKPKIVSPIDNEFEKHEFPALFTKPLSGFFETEILYETKKFIKVAKEYGFPIPAEFLELLHLSPENKQPIDDAETQSAPKADLISKYQDIAIDFCQGKKDRGVGLPDKTEIKAHLEKCLQGSGEYLGATHNSILPETMFRKILECIPAGELRQGRGGKKTR